jgi:hypothetical protein
MLVQPGSGRKPAKRISDETEEGEVQTSGIQLFDLSKDLEEKHNASTENPAKVRELLDLLKHARENQQ